MGRSRRVSLAARASFQRRELPNRIEAGSSDSIAEPRIHSRPAYQRRQMLSAAFPVISCHSVNAGCLSGHFHLLPAEPPRGMG